MPSTYTLLVLYRTVRSVHGSVDTFGISWLNYEMGAVGYFISGPFQL